MFRDRAGAGGVMAGVAGSEVGVCGVFACVLLALAEGFDLRSLKQCINRMLHISTSVSERIGDCRCRERREHRCELRDRPRNIP